MKIINYLSTDDLMSLLDAGVHVEDPAFVSDPEVIFSEDMFYSGLHRRSGSSVSRASRGGVPNVVAAAAAASSGDRESERTRDRDRLREREREREALRRERERWWGSIHVGRSEPSSANIPSKPTQPEKFTPRSTSSHSDPVSVSDNIQWWPDLVIIINNIN